MGRLKFFVEQIISHKGDSRKKKITKAEFSEWEKESVFDGLRGLRLGQSFCNHFDITDYVLYYSLQDEYKTKNPLI